MSSSQEAGCSCQVCWPAADFNSCRKRTYTLQTVSELRAPSAKNIQNLAFKHGRLASLKTLSLYTPVQPLIKDDLRANLQIVQETTAFIHHGSFKVQQVLLLYSCLLLSLLCFCFVLFCFGQYWFWPPTVKLTSYKSLVVKQPHISRSFSTVRQAFQDEQYTRCMLYGALVSSTN